VPQELTAGAVDSYYLSRDPVRLLVVVKQAGGFADAMNAGVNAAQYPVIGLVDPDAEFIPELLLRLIRPTWENCERYRSISLQSRSVAEVEREHERILDACERHDPDRAAAELARHLSITANLVARQMDWPDLFGEPIE